MTDKIKIRSAARTDGGSGFLLYTRVVGPAADTNYFNMAQVTSTEDFNRFTPGDSLACFYAVGDFASPGRQAALGDNDVASTSLPLFVVAGVRFYSGERCVSVLVLGDSQFQGFGTGANFGGFGRLAVHRLSGPAQRLSFLDGGYGGQRTAEICDRGIDLMNAGIPIDILVMPSDSPNDYGARVPRAEQEGNLRALRDMALSKGIRVIETTPIPYMHDGVDLAGLERVAGGDALRRPHPQGTIVFDAQVIVSGFMPTVAQPAATPPDLLADDQHHINGRAHEMLAAKLEPILDNMLASFRSAAGCRH